MTTTALALHAASITDSILDPIVNAATDLIDAVGLVGVFILMILESACIPIPSEAIMLFAGFSVSDGELTLFGVIAAGVLGNLVGSWIAYAAGYYGRVELLEQNRFIHINAKHLADGRPLVRASRRRHGLLLAGCCRSSAPSSRCPPAYRADAVLALHDLDRCSAAFPGSRAWR